MKRPVLYFSFGVLRIFYLHKIALRTLIFQLPRFGKKYQISHPPPPIKLICQGLSIINLYYLSSLQGYSFKVYRAVCIIFKNQSRRLVYESVEDIKIKFKLFRRQDGIIQFPQRDTLEKHKCFGVEIYYCISLQIQLLRQPEAAGFALVDIFIIKYIQVQYCSFQISIAASQVRRYFVKANKAKRAGTNKWLG